MGEKDIKLIRNNKVAMQIVNKAMQSDKNLNIFYIDASQNSIDSKSIDCPNKIDPPKQIENKEIVPNIIPSELGKIPGFVMDEFERVVKRFPQPVLGHVVRALFEIAYTQGNIDKQRGEFLGMPKTTFGYWRRKLKIDGGK